MRLTIDRSKSHGIAVKKQGRPLLKSAGLTVAGVCAGVVTEYLLDPERGRTRRSRLRDKSMHAAHEVTDGLGGMSRNMSHRGRGMAMAARYRITGRFTDDAVLHDRVRAELGRCVSHPHAVQVRVEGRTVTLIGDVLADEEKAARHAINRIPGVKHVDALWTVHEEEGDVPTLQGKRRSRAHLHADAKGPHTTS
jgi:osmotically-inducible protein OsmY